MIVTSQISLCEQPTHSALAQALRTSEDSGAKSILILACASDNWSPDDIDSTLQKQTLPIIGGVFPHVFFDNRVLDRGTVIVGLRDKLTVVVIENLSATQDICNPSLTGLLANPDPLNLITIVDGLSENIEVLTETLYDQSRGHVCVVGGGAGRADFTPTPCVFTNAGLKSDTALVAATPATFSCGTAHGWETLTGPFLVTGSTGNNIDSLNYEPAFEVYQQEIESLSGRAFNDDNFIDIAKNYPIGIENVDGEFLVRDPIGISGTSIASVGRVPVNSLIYILSSDTNKLIDAAEYAATEATTAANDDSPSTALVFDCISRALFLEGDFHKEVESLQRGINTNNVMIGATSLGEIGNTNRGPVELLNKSTIVARF